MDGMINVDEARAYAREHWPSPVVRRPLEAFLDNCPRVRVFCCSQCKHSEPIKENDDYSWCLATGKPRRNEWFCADAEPKEE